MSATPAGLSGSSDGRVPYGHLSQLDNLESHYEAHPQQSDIDHDLMSHRPFDPDQDPFRADEVLPADSYAPQVTRAGPGRDRDRVRTDAEDPRGLWDEQLMFPGTSQPPPGRPAETTPKPPTPLPPSHELAGGLSADHGDVIIHTVQEKSKSRWSHIDDLDSFFKKVYAYHQRHGFKVMMLQECLELIQFLLIVVLTVFLVYFVDYAMLFNEKPHAHSGRTTISDVVKPFGASLSSISFWSWLALVFAMVFWGFRAMATFYHFFQYWDIKEFYNDALHISDDELTSIGWQEVQQRLVAAQREHFMCIHKPQLTDLDIYHRILRFKNYLVAMVNKDLLPVHLNIPIYGEKIFLSHGLKYNLEFLFFKGPWAPFDQWHIKDDYKRASKKQHLVEQLQSKIGLLALVNLCCMPLILCWQVLYCFFSYADLVKREPGALGVRKWSLYARLNLRHFNELDHELKARLSRAYKPANKYMELFLSPLSGVIASNVSFVAGAFLAIIFALTLYDEDVIYVEHMLLVVSVLSGVIVVCRNFIPNENLVFCPEKTLTVVLAHIHYFPPSWKGQAHTYHVMNQLEALFPLTLDYLLQELLSPIVTPFVLYFCLRPRAAAVVDFFRNFTVDVVGVGDVCSFAQMDVRRHGNPQWQTPAEDDDSKPSAQQHHHQQQQQQPNPTCSRTNQYTQAEGGKTEMSLVHFALTNPEWKPPQASEQFINGLRDHAAREAGALTTVNEEFLPDNALYNSLQSLEAIGGVHAEMANSLLHGIRSTALQRSLGDQATHNRTAASISSGVFRPNSSSSMLRSVHAGLASGSSLLDNSSVFQQQQQQQQPAPQQSTTASRAGAAAAFLAPPPNLRQDLHRLRLDEYVAADMSLSALLIHALRQRTTSAASSTIGSTMGMGNSRQPHAQAAGFAPYQSYQSASGRFGHPTATMRFDSQQQQFRAISLNELDEENVPLMEAEADTAGELPPQGTAGAGGGRLSNSMLS